MGCCLVQMGKRKPPKHFDRSGKFLHAARVSEISVILCRSEVRPHKGGRIWGVIFATCLKLEAASDTTVCVLLFCKLLTVNPALVLPNMIIVTRYHYRPVEKGWHRRYEATSVSWAAFTKYPMYCREKQAGQGPLQKTTLPTWVEAGWTGNVRVFVIYNWQSACRVGTHPLLSSHFVIWIPCLYLLLCGCRCLKAHWAVILVILSYLLYKSYANKEILHVRFASARTWKHKKQAAAKLFNSA